MEKISKCIWAAILSLVFCAAMLALHYGVFAHKDPVAYQIPILITTILSYSGFASALGAVILAGIFAEKIQQANKSMETCTLKYFESLNEPLGWFIDVFTALKHFPSEKESGLEIIARILPEEWLKKAILLCVEERPELLTKSELRILQHQLVSNSSLETELFSKDEPFNYNAFSPVIVKYYALSGPYANTEKFATAILEKLVERGIDQIQSRCFVVDEIYKHLEPNNSLPKATIRDLHTEIFRQDIKKHVQEVCQDLKNKVT